MNTLICYGTPGANIELVIQLLTENGAIQLDADTLDQHLQAECQKEQMRAVVQPATKVSGSVTPFTRQTDGDTEIAQTVAQPLYFYAEPIEIENLERIQSEHSNIGFILCFDRPEAEYVSNQPHDSLDQFSEAPLNQWMDYNRQLLNFYKRNRNIALLVEAPALAQQGAGALQYFNTKLGLTLHHPADRKPPHQSEHQPLLISLARQWLGHNRDMENLYIELQVNTALASEDQNAEIAELSLKQYQDLLTSIASEKQRRKKVKDKFERAKKRLKKQSGINLELTAEIEALTISADEGQERIGQLEKQLQSLTSENQRIPSLLEQKSSLDQEVELLQLQLHQIEEELEQQLLSNEKEKSTGQEQQSNLQQENSDLKKELELLQLQLHQVQEELEVYFIRATQVQKADTSISPCIRSITMNEFIDGSNWYPAEHNAEGYFRWTGPDSRATTSVDINRTESQTLLIEYRNSYKPSQMAGLSIEIDGAPVSHRLHTQTRPAFIEVQIPASPDTDTSSTQLAICLKETLRPSEHEESSEDSRKLGLCINAIHIIPNTLKGALSVDFTLVERLKLKWLKLTTGLSINSYPILAFDGNGYLTDNPDTADAINAGRYSSALAHYLFAGLRAKKAITIARGGIPNVGSAG